MLTTSKAPSSLFFPLLLLFLMVGQEVLAQPCPPGRVKKQSRMFLSVYGVPHFHIFAFEAPEIKGGITGGAGVGLKLNRTWDLQAAVEFSQVNREIERGLQGTFEYRTQFVEIPVEVRWHWYTALRGRDQAVFTLGSESGF